MTLLCLIGFLIFIWSFLMAVVVGPDDWDAWAVWGAKAKVLALTNGSLKDVIYFGPRDYPLLWPAVWAFSGWSAGGWEEHWSRAWGPIFMLLTAWQIYIIIKRQTLQSKTALIAATLFLSIPMVPLVASWSYAEASLWLMMTCCFGCLIRWKTHESRINLFLAALFATAAAYTKNEGLLFAILGFIWILATNRNRWQDAIFVYLMPIFLLYAPWAYWTRISIALSSDALTGLVFDGNRIIMSLRHFPDALSLIGNIWLSIKQWNVVLGLLGLGVIFYFVRGNREQRIDIMLPIAMLLGCLVIIISHYQNLYWQIGTAWDRLTLQTIPIFILAVMKHPIQIFSGGYKP